MQYKNFKDLKVWHKAMDLSVAVYEVSKQFPREEMFSLTDQIRRASVSIPSNIAEGHDRNTPNDMKNFYYIAHGSLAEVETQLELSVRLGYVTEDTAKDVKTQIFEVRKMLWALIQHTCVLGASYADKK